jgi:hypothetical protein
VAAFHRVVTVVRKGGGLAQARPRRKRGGSGRRSCMGERRPAPPGCGGAQRVAMVPFCHAWRQGRAWGWRGGVQHVKKKTCVGQCGKKEGKRWGQPKRLVAFLIYLKFSKGLKFEMVKRWPSPT